VGDPFAQAARANLNCAECMSAKEMKIISVYERTPAYAVHRPIREGRENVAEDWSRKLWRTILPKHYWYLFPFCMFLLAWLHQLSEDGSE